MRKKFVLLTALIFVFVMVAAGCQSATATEIEVSGEKIPSLYAALGEPRTVTGTGTETGIGYSAKKVSYSGVSADDLMSYYYYLESNGYICTDESGTTIQMAREGAEDGYIVLVDMVLTSGASAEISYTYTVGELTYYD